MAQDRMQRQRFEFKYLLTERKAREVREYVLTQLELDEAGQGKENNAYRVNSLYLDSDPLLTFFDWVNSNRNRFKIRMRYYDEEPHTPVFLEIKRRVSGCILKQRCAVRKSAASIVLAGQIPEGQLIVSRDPRQLVALENFITLVLRTEPAPKPWSPTCARPTSTRTMKECG